MVSREGLQRLSESVRQMLVTILEMLFVSVVPPTIFPAISLVDVLAKLVKLSFGEFNRDLLSSHIHPLSTCF